MTRIITCIVSAILLSLLATGCDANQTTETPWINQETPFPTTIAEYARDGISLNAALAADFTADKISVTSPDGMVILVEGVGAQRSDVLAELPAVVQALAERDAQMVAAIQTLADIAESLKPDLPIDLGGDDQ